MQLAIQKIGIVILGVALAVGSASFAFAEEVSAEASASAQVNVGVQGQKPRPLQLLHDTRVQLKAEARESLGELKDDAKDIKTERNMELRNASSGPERRDIVKEARTELKANMKDRLQVLFRTHLGSAVARFNAALQHFENIVARIESRIEKLEDRGVDTASVEADLAVAVGAIATAKVDVQALSSIGSSVTASSTAEQVKASMRAAMQKATESIKAAHRALMATAKELSALVRASAEINSETSVDSDN